MDSVDKEMEKREELTVKSLPLLPVWALSPGDQREAAF